MGPIISTLIQLDTITLLNNPGVPRISHLIFFLNLQTVVHSDFKR